MNWAQLDLARQMESLDFIRDFIDIMAKAGYDGILLYLEDRIRTASYPYPADGECYTEEEIRGLVKYAQERRMELIPCVATLGHAERFLAHPELAHLAELQGDMCGRFGGKRKETFCPTHPEFYDFLLAYLKEVAALFPTKYFHAGLDEFWDYCLCDRCRAAAPDFAAQQALFVKHVQKVHDFLASCGKRMVMWSDMFEYYPEALPQVPRDILMADWLYHTDVRNYMSHLFDAKIENRIARNAELGFETILAPVDMCYRNPQTYLEYAAGKPYVGCILTSWEKSDSFLYRTLPTFVFAGYLMRGKTPEEATVAMAKQLFGTTDAVLAAGVTLALTEQPWRHFRSIARTTLFSRNFMGLRYESFEAIETARTNILARRQLVTSELGTRILDDLLAALEERRISNRLQRHFLAALDGEQTVENFDELRRQFATLLDTMDERWKMWRSGIPGNTFEVQKAKLCKQLDDLHRELVSSKFVRVRVCVPDGYVVEHLCVSLQFEKDGDWTQIYDGITKPPELEYAVSEHFLPYQADRKPIAARVAAYGMGGIGVCYIEVDGQKPTAIRKVTGFVREPEQLLLNDINFAWFGSQSTEEAYFSKPLAQTRHCVEVML